MHDGGPYLVALLPQRSALQAVAQSVETEADAYQIISDSCRLMIKEKLSAMDLQDDRRAELCKRGRSRWEGIFT
jgi:hypothetical protein